MHLLIISLARNILTPHSRERKRMEAYAKQLGSFHVVILTRTAHGMSKEVHEGNLHIYPTQSSSRIGMLYDAFKISYRILKTLPQTRVISAQDPLEIGYLSLILSKFTGTAFHVQVHGDYFSSDAWIQGSLVQRIRRKCAQALLVRARAIRVVSERIKKSLIQYGVTGSAITVLPIRPELSAFIKARIAHDDTSRCRFVFFGRLAKEKDLHRILEAFAIVHTKHPYVELHLIGDGEEKKSLIERIQNLSLNHSVFLSPWTEDTPRVVAPFDVAVLASKHEAYALTLIEALALGIPVVTTDVGCVGEVVRDGVQGIVVREEGALAYANALERMVVDTTFRKACGIEGQKTADTLARVSEEVYVRAWVTAIEKALPPGYNSGHAQQ